MSPQTDYGYLYNWWAAIGDTDGDNISNKTITSSDDWRVPDKNTDMNPLINGYLTANQGEKLKESGTDHWDTDNGTDNFNLSLRGAGQRSSTNGVFSSQNLLASFWSTHEASVDLGYGFSLVHDSGSISSANDDKNRGKSLFLCKDAVGVSDGAQITYTGNNGKVYKAVCIDEKYWTEQLCETQYRDGTYIQGYDSGTYTPISNTTWYNLTSAAMCAYEDNESNALI